MSVDTVRDLTGLAVSHRIHESLVVQRERLWWLAPTRRPFFTRGLVIHDPLRGVDLVAGDDYCVIHLDDEWSTRTQQEVGHFLVILDGKVGSILDLTYQALGGDLSEDAPTIQELRDYVATSEGNPRWGVFVRREVVDPDIEAILELTKRVTFQHVVEETENIRTALMYGDAEHHQEMMLYAVDTRTRYYNRILQLLQTARDAINAHAADKFGHQLHKDQIGLMEFPNYPVATQIVLEAGASSKHLLTPKGFSVMLARFADGPLQEHYLEEPAHNLTATQVGLSNIHNFPLANPTEAQLGNKKDRYMTPGVSLGALHYQYSSKFYAHQIDKDAHEVTPFQVGLGNYANYALYDPQDHANAPMVDDRYITPKGVYDVIRHHYWDDHLSHVYDEDNPHELTAEQIGLGSVTNLSRDAYDALHSLKNHHHVARTLPFTDSELSDWMDTAEWVLDSKVTNKVSGTIWSSSGSKSGNTVVNFPDTQSTRINQQNTIIKATNRQTGKVEEKEGTVSLMVEQISPIAGSGTEEAVIPWKTVIRGDGSVADLTVPDLPEEAWPFTEVLITSTDSELSTVTKADVLNHVSRVEINGSWVTMVNESLIRDEVFRDVPEDLSVPVTFFFKYDRPSGGVLRYRYQINNALFWLESKRLFPELSYKDHTVVGDLYFVMELPERLKGPDGIFFRGGGHYPYLRAGSTTKGDVGLSKVPDWSKEDMEGKYALSNHVHEGVDWIARSVMNNTYLTKNNFSAIVRSIKIRVFTYIAQSGVRKSSLKASGSTFTRLKEWENPVRDFEYMLNYRDTHWVVWEYKGDNHPGSSRLNWSKSQRGGQTYNIPIIRPNTGKYEVEATHYLWDSPNNIGSYGGQTGSILVDTGEPKNPKEWVMDIYKTMLARGDDIYGLQVGNNGAISWLDATGPAYWMNLSGVNTKKELQKEMALTTVEKAHSAGGPSAGNAFGTPDPYYNSVAWLDSNYPGWNWNPWAEVHVATFIDSDDAATEIQKYNSGSKNTRGVQYKNANFRFPDPNSDPLIQELWVSKRVAKWPLFS